MLSQDIMGSLLMLQWNTQITQSSNDASCNSAFYHTDS